MDLNYCTREALNIPSGERYELCRSVHAEANAIISAARSEALGATLYMACVEPESGALIPGSTSCSMCRRLIITPASPVVIRDTRTEYRVVDVADWCGRTTPCPDPFEAQGRRKLIPNRNVLDKKAAADLKIDKV